MRGFAAGCPLEDPPVRRHIAGLSSSEFARGRYQLAAPLAGLFGAADEEARGLPSRLWTRSVARGDFPGEEHT